MLLPSLLFAKQGDPIPGVDVSIEQSPGGIIISQTQTNSNGYYVFTSIPIGTYKITVTYNSHTGKIKATKAPMIFASSNYNSSKSNTAGISVSASNNGQQLTAAVTTIDGITTQVFNFVVTQNNSTISGTFEAIRPAQTIVKLTPTKTSN